MVAVTTDPDEHPIPADADGTHDGVSAVMAEYKLAEHEKNRAWKILGAGSVAGTLSGLMGTLAGQPGPPLILMFALLKVPKVLTSSTCSTSDGNGILLLCANAADLSTNLHANIQPDTNSKSQHVLQCALIGMTIKAHDAYC